MKHKLECFVDTQKYLKLNSQLKYRLHTFINSDYKKINFNVYKKVCVSYITFKVLK
jgi:hypothetical protein